MRPLPSGVLLVDKSAGPTSHDVVAAVRRRLLPRRRFLAAGRRYRVGHAGTLDPRATGLLLVLLGRGTRLAPLLVGLDKVYRAEIRFGVATDTLDGDGRVTATAPVAASAEDLGAALRAFVGTQDQRPPVFSAIKQHGRPLHRLVRRGGPVEEPAPRRITITRLDLEDLVWGAAAAVDESGLARDGRLYRAVVTVACSSGTYVRCVARDLAARLGTVGHLHALRRLQIGPFAIADATALDTWLASEDPAAAVLPLAASLPHLPAAPVDATVAAAIRRSGRLAAGDPVADLARPWCCLVDAAGALVAVVHRDDLDPQPRLVAVFPRDGDVEDEGCA